MNTIMKSWKTTSLGVLTIVTLAATTATQLIKGEPVDWNFVLATFITAVGLILAKDANVTGGTVSNGAKPLPPGTN